MSHADASAATGRLARILETAPRRPSGNPYLWHHGVMSDLDDLASGNAPLYLLWATAIKFPRGDLGLRRDREGRYSRFSRDPDQHCIRRRECLACRGKREQPDRALR